MITLSTEPERSPGAVDAAMCARSIGTRADPPTTNRRLCDPGCAAAIAPARDPESTIRAAQSNSIPHAHNVSSAFRRRI
jgi:hypothetical protein